MRDEQRQQRVREPDENILDAAHDFLRRGWKPLPIVDGKNRPSEQEWQNMEVTLDNYERRFKRWHTNIGIQFGACSRGLCDVDLDCRQTLQLADDFLPRTAAEFGRKSKPQAHRLYYSGLHKTDDRAAIQFADPVDGAMLVELRIGGGGKGAQTLAPPSVHRSGEVVRWDHDRKPAQVDGIELKRRVARLASAALLARHYPGEGSRHKVALVIGGVLARAGFSEQDIAHFVGCVARCAGDDETVDRINSAKSAAARVANRQPVAGLLRLREMFGDKIADKLADWLELKDRDNVLSNQPVEVAISFVRSRFSGLVHYRGAFYQWTGTHYDTVEDSHLRSMVYEFCKDAVVVNKHGDHVPFNPRTNKINEIIDALKAAVEANGKFDAPFWGDQVDTSTVPNAADLIALRNGLFDLTKRELNPHDPLLFNVNCLPFDYDPAAKAPQWKEFLGQLWPDEAEDADAPTDDDLSYYALQEAFGLLVTADTRFQVIIFIEGPKRSGKGTIARVLTAMLGPENVAHPTLKSLATNFGLAPLVDKRVAVISDIRLGQKTDVHALVEQLLRISGEDAVTIDRKYRDHWTGKLSVRFVLLSNELPDLPDASGAIASRFVCLTLRRSFYGEEDPQLTEKLLTELSGIFNWALIGLDRLRERGRFELPASAREVMRRMEDLGSPVLAFVRACAVVGPDETVSMERLYGAYRFWSDSHGIAPESSNVFGRELHAAVSAKVTLDVRKVKGVRCYIGVGLRDDDRPPPLHR